MPDQRAGAVGQERGQVAGQKRSNLFGLHQRVADRGHIAGARTIQRKARQGAVDVVNAAQGVTHIIAQTAVFGKIGYGLLPRQNRV